MYYVISFDDCGLESPLRARSPISALGIAEEAERNGCKGVMIELPDGDTLPLREFAQLYGEPATSNASRGT